MSFPLILQTIGLFFCSLSAIILPFKTVFGTQAKAPTLMGRFFDAAWLVFLGLFNFVFALQFGGKLFTNPEFITFITGNLP